MANEFKIKNGLIISGTLSTAQNENTLLVIDTNGVVKTKEDAGSPTQAIGINSIPASLSISTFLASNNWRDAFVAIPTEYNDWTIDTLTASYGDAWPTDEVSSTFKIEIRDTTNTVSTNSTYSHPGNTRNVIDPTFTPLTLTKGYTINVFCTETEGLPRGGGTPKGYTVTLQINEPV